MKKFICYLVFLLINCIPNYSQEMIKDQGFKINEIIQQIHLPGEDDMLILRVMRQELANGVFAFQAGSQNKAIINQQNTINPDISNQTYSFQSGNSNELNIEQTGSGNIMLGFQLGYLTKIRENGHDAKGDDNTVLCASKPQKPNTLVVEGERNKMDFTQNGIDNSIMAIQQGSDNRIMAEQLGNNNYLVAVQKGNNNTVETYEQRNSTYKSGYDSILQLGDNLSLIIDDASSSPSIYNKFEQRGSNLQIEVNNDMSNATGGIDITQKGDGMKVLIDQSFFLFPMR